MSEGKEEAKRQARAIEEYWHSQGYHGVHAHAKMKQESVHGRRISYWAVASNLVNGRPE